MELHIEEIESIGERLSRLIDETTTVMNFKIDIDEDDAILYKRNQSYTNFDGLHIIRLYLSSLKVDIIYSSCGVHFKGENKRPHIHWHFILKNIPSGTFKTCNSTHRKRWLDAQATKGFHWNFDNISVKFPKKEKPVWQTLAYPFKEGHAVKGFSQLSLEEFEFLMTYGKNLYEVSLANRERQDASEDRRRVALNSLAQLCRNNKDKFSTFEQMVYWLDDNFMALLPLDEKPDGRQYTSNCHRIGNELGLFKYSSLVLGKRN